MSASWNIRSGRFFIASTVGRCRKCQAAAPLFALAVPAGHKTLDLDDAVPDEQEAHVWSAAEYPALLFYVESLSETVRTRLERRAPSYHVGRCEDDMDGCWANHCVRCGACLGDHELFCEPDGAFLPTTPTRAGCIGLMAIDEPFAARAAGYTVDPPFFDVMSRG